MRNYEFVKLLCVYLDKMHNFQLVLLFLKEIVSSCYIILLPNDLVLGQQDISLPIESIL